MPATHLGCELRECEKRLLQRFVVIKLVIEHCEDGIDLRLVIVSIEARMQCFVGFTQNGQVRP